MQLSNAIGPMGSILQVQAMQEAHALARKRRRMGRWVTPSSPRGQEERTMSRRRSIDRIMSHIEKIDGGHWIWTAKGRTGLNNEYGGTRLNGKAMSSHRAVWIIHKGPIPKGAILLHQCEVKLCCNPDHLKLGTHKENTQEAITARGGIHWQQLFRRVIPKRHIERIIKRWKSGERQADIAKSYGVNQAAISKTIRKHIATMHSFPSI